jgi:pSer/pThr/pTyr-binding forkhead associated (FHA) protein
MAARQLKGPKLDEYGLNSVSIESLGEKLVNRGMENFRRRYNCAFLVLLEGPQQWTDWVDLNTSEASLRPLDQTAQHSRTSRIIPLVKSKRNAYGSMITLGRARNNDVIIRATKVSKLHASFHCKERDTYFLEDMGSKNGTVVNGSRLARKKRVGLADGDLLSFWHYLFEFVVLGSMLTFVEENSPF